MPQNKRSHRQSGIRIISIFLFILLSLEASAFELPEGWRLPSTEELSGEERDSQHNAYISENRFTKAEGDFNGDGKIDGAYILISNKFNGDGLFLYLSDIKGYQWHMLDENNWDKSYPDKNYAYSSPSMGVGTLPPDTFRRYVEKSRPTPTDIVPTEVDFSNPALDYFRFESAGSLFFWSNTEHRLVRFWYSD
jgi:hypothetical protein